MAAVTATILLGGSHPNDTSVDPYYLMKLWEGDRAACVTASAKANTESPENSVTTTAERSSPSAVIGNAFGGPVSSYPLLKADDGWLATPPSMASNSLMAQEYPLCHYSLKERRFP